MNASGFGRYAGALVALALWAGCSGGSVPLPSNAPAANPYVGKAVFFDGRPVTAAYVNLNRVPRYPTMIPDAFAKANTKYFEYTINMYGTYASIFNYPKGNRQIGTLENVGGQGCTNVRHGYGKKTFWIVAGPDQITEYGALKTPIKTLSVPDGTMPSSCAMNEAGDLAVGMLFGKSAGKVIVYKNARGSGTLVKSPLAREYFDGYDDRGNLFFDGLTSDENFMLVELPKGSATAKIIKTSNTVQFPGSVQWDGKYVTVFDQLAGKMYRYVVSGSTATLQKTVVFSGSGDCAQTWIAKGVVYCADAGQDDGLVFDYPAGGSPVAIFQGNFDEPLGTVAVMK